MNRLCVRPSHSVRAGHYSVVEPSTRDGDKLVISPSNSTPLLNSTCRNRSIRPSDAIGTRHHTVRGSHSHRDKRIVSVGNARPAVGARAPSGPCNTVGTCHDAVRTETCDCNEHAISECHGSPRTCGHTAWCPRDAVSTRHYTVRSSGADCDKGAVSKSDTVPTVRFCCAARGPCGSVGANLLRHDRDRGN